MAMTTSATKVESGTANAETIRTIYAAFGRGDVPAILSHLTENVDWDNSRDSAKEIPWHGNFSGKAKVPGFFTAIAKHVDVPVLELKEFVSDDRGVAVRLHVRLVVKKNGRAAEFDAIHLWTFDGQGRVAGYRQFNDTAAELAAWRG